MLNCEIVATPLGAGRWRHHCHRCGRDHVAPVAAARYPCQCPHLGEAVTFRSGPDAGRPVTVEVTCDGCNGQRQQVAQPVYRCALFGRCLPTYRPTGATREAYLRRDDRVRLCDGCEAVRRPGGQK